MMMSDVVRGDAYGGKLRTPANLVMELCGMTRSARRRRSPYGKIPITQNEIFTRSQGCQINICALSQKLAMPGICDRTENDHREVLSRKAEVEAISHERAMDGYV